MDTECGIIVEIRARMALVEASAGEACAACSSRGSCSLIGGESKRRLWMENRAGGRKGDTIEFAIAPGAVVRMSLLLYAFPVVALIAGMFAGMALAPRLGLDADLAAALFGAGGFALSFGIVKAISAILARGKSFQPVMIRVLGDGRADALLTDARDTVRDAKETLAHEKKELEKMKLSETTNKANRMIDDLSRRSKTITTEVQQTSENLRRASDNLDQLIQRLKADPSDILFSDPPPKKR